MLKFSQYDETQNMLVGRNDGNEIVAVRVLNPDGTERYTETFADSRHADRAIADARAYLKQA